MPAIAEGSPLIDLQHIGDPQRVWEDLQAFAESVQVLSHADTKLLNDYPQQWVAVYDGKVASHGDSLEVVIGELETSGVPRDSVIIRYMEREPRTLIL